MKKYIMQVFGMGILVVMTGCATKQVGIIIMRDIVH